MSKIVWVVHRYYPYPGGSENNVRNISETMVKAGHDVTVWAPTNMGDQNGVKVTADTSIFTQPQDLIILHGAGPGPQNFIIQNLQNISSPTLYYIIKPEETPFHIHALNNCTYIAASTPEDYEFVKKYKVEHKTIDVRYGILESEVYGNRTFRDKFNLPKDKKMYLSCGGYWANKAMKELVADFKNAYNDNSFLVTTGYYNGDNLMPENSENVYNFILEDRTDVLNAMADADYYIMNSFNEGYGLVLLEAMFNKKPWISRYITAAKIFKDRGITYNNSNELISILKNINEYSIDVESNYQFVKNNHTSEHTVNDLLRVLK